MGSFETKVKFNELKHKLKKGVRVISSSFKKGWFKVKHIKR